MVLLMSKFIEILRFALNHDSALPLSMANGGTWTAEQWQKVMAVAERQTVVCIVIQGMSRLPEEMRPPKKIVDYCIAKTMMTRRLNMRLYSRTVELSRMLQDMGISSCILKGQGNALMYDDAFIREPGDIDVWTSASKREILAMVGEKFPDVKNEFHHIDYPVFADVPVEVHHFPSYMFNPLHNRRMQRFYSEQKQRMMANIVEAPEGIGRFAVPDASFNAVFQLSHVFRHLLVQGVGMRHLVDYFYVLKNLPQDEAARQQIVRQLRRVGLLSFAGAVMYVEKEWLGIEERYLIVAPDERRGRQLMQSVMCGGNFGKYNKKTWLYGKGFMDRQVRKFQRSWVFLTTYPSEVLSEPFFRMMFYVQRKLGR